MKSRIWDGAPLHLLDINKRKKNKVLKRKHRNLDQHSIPYRAGLRVNSDLKPSINIYKSNLSSHLLGSIAQRAARKA